MIIYTFIIIAGIYLDQLTKWLAVTSLKNNPSYPIWKGVLHFTYVENTGAAFGMMKGYRWLFMIVSTVAIVGMLLYIFIKRPQNRLLGAAIALIVSGGIGNMIDRIMLGYVVDFIDFTIINFAVFNFADSLVCIGAALMIACILFGWGEKTKNVAETA